MKSAWGSLAAVCALVIAVYACMARSAAWESLSPKAADLYYNLLVDGFRAGQLSLKKEVPPGLARLADPYDPAANAVYRVSPYRTYDLSYYKGRLYLYFGVTPALILFWPFVGLTGHYLSHREAAVIFSAMGFLASIGMLRGLWRRYFAEVNVWVVAACALALGLTTGVPVILPQSVYNEVAICCGYMLTMLALAAIWRALHETERRCQWLAAASVAYGLAVGARPSLLFGAVILLVPVVHASRERQRVWTLLVAAFVPITLIGLGLMLYNARRFGSPFEFGQSYQLVERRQVAQRLLRLQYLWFNFRVYFLEPARWSARFPFVHGIAVPPLPEDYWDVENPFGVLTNIPLVWLALAVPLAWRNRSGQAASILRWFVTAAALLFGICALSVGFYRSAVIRYEVDFLPPLVLLAVVGILGLEHTLVGQPVRRRVVRWCWGVLLGFSTAFNLLASVQCYTYGRWTLGFALAQEGRASEAIQIYEEVLRLRPEFTEAHASLAHILQRTGKMPEAIAEYEKVVRLKPNYAEAHNDLGLALQQMGKIDEAITHYEQALRLKPDDADTHYNLGTALGQAGRLPEATSQYEQALRLKPDYADAHNNLGIALAQAGQLPGAIQEYEQAIRIEPDSAEAHYNLGKAFLQEGRLSDAIGQYEQALRINPDSAGAHYNLGRAFLQEGRFSDAIGQYEQVLRLKPDYAEAHNNLAWVLATAPPAQGGDPVRAVGLAQRACELSGNRVPGDLDTLAVAYAAVGRFDAAVATAQKAIDLARAVGQAELAQEIAARLELYRNGRAYSPSTGVTSPGNP